MNHVLNAFLQAISAFAGQEQVLLGQAASFCPAARVHLATEGVCRCLSPCCARAQVHSVHSELDVDVAAVAVWRHVCLLATAQQVKTLGLVSNKAHGLEVGSMLCMRVVAEWLCLAVAACAVLVCTALHHVLLSAVARGL